MVCIKCKQSAKMKCSKCMVARYCCSEHQKDDWNEHKHKCDDLHQIYLKSRDCKDNSRDNIKKNIAIISFQKGVEMGNLNDYVNLAKCYLRGEGVQKDLDKAVTLAEYAGANGCSDGYFFMGNFFANKIKPDMNTAYEYYNKAIEQGNTYAMQELASMYLSGNGVKKDKMKFIEYMNRAVKLGAVHAMEDLAFYYTQKCLDIKKIKKGIALLHKAIDKKSAQATYIMGDCYHFGIGVKKDIQIGYNYMNSAANMGSAHAKEFINEHKVCCYSTF